MDHEPQTLRGRLHQCPSGPPGAPTDTAPPKPVNKSQLGLAASPDQPTTLACLTHLKTRSTRTRSSSSTTSEGHSQTEPDAAAASSSSSSSWEYNCEFDYDRREFFARHMPHATSFGEFLLRLAYIRHHMLSPNDPSNTVGTSALATLSASPQAHGRSRPKIRPKPIDIPPIAIHQQRNQPSGALEWLHKWISANKTTWTFVQMGLLCGLCELFLRSESFQHRFSLWITKSVLMVKLFCVSGMVYLAISFLLCQLHWTNQIGELLRYRLLSAFSVWKYDSVRSFLEVCIWFVAVMQFFLLLGSDQMLLATLSGVLFAITAVLTSDVATAYLTIHEVRRRRHRGRYERIIWLRVILSCVCTVISVNLVLMSLASFYGLHKCFARSLVTQISINIALDVFVGMSIVIASELLLLYQPAREAGVILQSRMVHARKNWEEHPARSILEISIANTVIVIAFEKYQDFMMTAHIGTVCTLILILGGEYCAMRFASLDVSASDLLPEDHYIKFLPLLCLTGAFAIRVCQVMITYPLFNTSSSAIPSNQLVLVATGALFGVVLLFAMRYFRVGRFRRSKMTGKTSDYAAILCLFSTMGSAYVLFGDGIMAICLGVFALLCTLLAGECWAEMHLCDRSHSPKGDGDLFDDGGMKGNANAKNWKERSPRLELPNQWIHWLAMRFQTSWIRQCLRYAKTHYRFAYTRIKWTFLVLAVLSCFDLGSTVLSFVMNQRLECTILDFLGGTIVFATITGYLSSSVDLDVHPQQLVTLGYHQLRKKWLLFPLRILVESVVFFGVFIGTLAMSSNVFGSVSLAVLSDVVVSIGGQWVCSSLRLDIREKARTQLTASCAFVFCIVLIYVSILCFFWIYHHIASIEAAFFLTSLSGVVFLASSELFLLWEPTRKAGHLLQGRVLNAQENWQNEPLRSFVELSTWIAVLYGSFMVYEDLLLALQLSTFCGIVMALMGEVFRQKSMSLISSSDAEDSTTQDPLMAANEAYPNGRPKVLPLMLLFAYLGSGTFQWIFENKRSLEVTFVLATFAGIAFLCIADLLVLYKPTRWVGIILQDRFVRTKENWQEYPVRSFVELGCFLGVIYGSYALYGDLVVAVQVGTLSGMLVALIGDQAKSHTSKLAMELSAKQQVNEKTQVLALPVMALLGLVGMIAFNIIYTHLRRLEIAFVLATMSGVAFMVLGDMFVIWTPTRKVGLIVQERILNARKNMQMHAWRSWLELFLSAFALYWSYAFVFVGDILIAIQVGTSTGVIACVSTELTMEYVRDKERQMVEQASKRWRQSCNVNPAGLVGLPYEVLFEVARFLTPEELLLARLTCHKINDMISAESHRLWLLLRVRRRFSLINVQGRRLNGIGSQIRNRSLVYEAIKMILPKIFRSREPSSILSSDVRMNRALKWVYLNANWIRKQALPQLPEKAIQAKQISVLPGDVAFGVFRHIPDKSHLGILVERNKASHTIERLQVPLSVYAQIQKDPLSFVAAETLAEIDAFSPWHACFVAFFAMMFIFMGQFAHLSAGVLEDSVAKRLQVTRGK